MDSRNVRDKMEIDKRTCVWWPEDDEKATSGIHVCFPELGDSLVDVLCLEILRAKLPHE